MFVVASLHYRFPVPMTDLKIASTFKLYSEAAFTVQIPRACARM